VQYRILAVLAIAHALFISLCWFSVGWTGHMILPARIWLALACAWPLWLIVLAFHPARSLRTFLFTAAIGLLLWFYCFPALAAFVVWRTRGFAP
jgi:hypothetical protein